MIQIAILVAWALVGVVCAALPDRRGLAFAPIAMILGPLWLAVSAEQRQLAPASLEAPARAHRH